jgi:tetratricopeptide (TPR) repeat protein
MPTRHAARRLTRPAVLLAICAAGLSLASCGQRSLLAVRQSGDAHYRSERYDEAKADYLEYLDRAPGRAEVHHMLGRTYMAQGQTALAVEQLQVARAIRMEDDAIFASLCEALYADKQLDELNRVLRARTVDRGRMQDWSLLAQYAEKLGDRDEAQRAWLTAAQVSAGASATPHLGLARLYMSIGDTERARRQAAMAYFIEPLNAEVNELVRQMGEIPGPTFGIPPETAGPDAADIQATPPLSPAAPQGMGGQDGR